MVTKRAVVDYVDVRNLRGFKTFFESVNYEAPVCYGDASFTLINKEKMLDWLREYDAPAKLIEIVESFPKDVFFNWE